MILIVAVSPMRAPLFKIPIPQFTYGESQAIGFYALGLFCRMLLGLGYTGITTLIDIPLQFTCFFLCLWDRPRCRAANCYAYCFAQIPSLKHVGRLSRWGRSQPKTGHRRIPKESLALFGRTVKPRHSPGRESHSCQSRPRKSSLHRTKCNDGCKQISSIIANLDQQK